MEEVRAAWRKWLCLGWDKITIMTCDIDNYMQYSLRTYCMSNSVLNSLLPHRNPVRLLLLEILRSKKPKHRETQSFAQHRTWTHSIGEILRPAAQLQSLLSRQYCKLPMVVRVDNTEKAEWWAMKQMRTDELSKWTPFSMSRIPPLFETNKSQREGDIRDGCFQDCTFILLSLGA